VCAIRWMTRLATLVGAFVLLSPAAPAQAHDVGGVGATNFQTTVSALSPAVDGVSLAVIENGSRLELRNATATEVVISGYGGEPYARVGPGGVYLNDNSPATYLNASRFSTTPVPEGVDGTKSPQWRQVETEPVFRWHDHRIHWMLSTLPPSVAADPSVARQISSWTVNLSYGGAPLSVTGTLRWVPGPNPYPWFALGILIAAGLAVAPLLARPHRMLAAAALLAVGAEIVHGVGVMLVETGSVPERLGALFGSDALLIWPSTFLGAWLLWHRHTRALWIAAAAGLVMASTLVLHDAPVWWRSSAPTALPLTLNRLLVALVVGAGAGLAAALPLMLRRHRTPPTPIPTSGESIMGRPVPNSVDHGRRSMIDAGAGAGAGDAGAGAGAGDAGAGVGAGDAGAGVGAGDAGAGVGAGDANAGAGAGVGTGDAGGGGGVGRRRVAGVLTAGALGAIVGAAGGVTLARSRQDGSTPMGPGLADVGARTIPFYGPRQAGIVTPGRPQAQVWIAGFDLAAGVDRVALMGLLTQWTRAAEALTAGRGLGHTDDAVVTGLGPSALTITVGFGPSLFGRAEIPFAARPEALAPLPPFAGERLDPARGDGDIGVVVAADDPVVVQHAARVLRRLAAGVAQLRWQASGFNAARGNGAESATPRNLMGQVDGTNNPKATDPDFAARVFAAGPAWLAGGSYLVVRRIRMLLDDWDGVALADQERVIGRRKDDGAPLSGGSEFTPPNFGARGADGALAIGANAHMRRASPAFNEGAVMLRRGFSYVDGNSAGLLFLAWQADPRRGFIPVQRALVESDALGRFIRHETSALFAMPGGVAEGGYLGQKLLEG
jgi:deferrochelatase/peroxidase EfeB